MAVGATGLRVRGGRFRVTAAAPGALDSSTGILDGRRTLAATTIALGDITFEDVDLLGDTQLIYFQSEGRCAFRRVRSTSPSMNYSGSAIILSATVAPSEFVMDSCLVNGGTVRNHASVAVAPTQRLQFTNNRGVSNLSASLAGPATVTTLMTGNDHRTTAGGSGVVPALTGSLVTARAGGAKFHANFPTTNDDPAPPPVIIQPQAMTAVSGSPALGWIGTGGTDRIIGMMLDAVAFEVASGSVIVPADWSSCYVDFVWANGAAGAGDVRFACYVSQLADGATLGAVTSGTLTVTAPASNTVKVSRLISTPVTVVAGSLLTVRVARDGANAADTLANDAAVLAVLITKAN